MITSIIFHIEIVEGKHRPKELGEKTYDKVNGIKLKTIRLILRITKSIHHSSRVVIMDSGFCVLRGIIELAKKRVYGSAVIKKIRYWTKYINGDAIKQPFADKEVGDHDALPGKLDNVPFHIFCLKEEDYVMSLMSSYGCMGKKGEANRILTNKEKLTFQYCEVIDNHFIGQHAVDDNNKKRMQAIALEKTWNTVN